MIVAWVDGGAPEGSRSRSADSADVRRRVVDRQARLVILKMLQPFNGAGRRHGAVHVHHHSDELEGRHLDPRRRAEADRPPRRPPHHQRPGGGQRQAGRSGAEADSRSQLARRFGGGLGGLVPGRLVRRLYEEGVARKIPAGADIVLQMHYTTIGQPVDRPDRGRRRARARSRRRGCAPSARRRTDAEPDVRHSARRMANYEVSAQDRRSRSDTYLTHRCIRTCTCAGRT